MVRRGKGCGRVEEKPNVIAAGTVGRNVLVAQVGEEIRRYEWTVRMVRMWTKDQARQSM